jgi:hypothetical protein
VSAGDLKTRCHEVAVKARAAAYMHAQPRIGVGVEEFDLVGEATILRRMMASEWAGACRKRSV